MTQLFHQGKIAQRQNYLDLFKKRYGNKVVYFNSFRTNTTKAFHFKNARLNHRYKMGRDILVEMLVLSKMKCYYCNENMLLVYENVREGKQWTLDRIDNSIGHITENVVISCLDCNLKRRTMNDEKFKFSKQMKIIKKN